MCDVKEIKNLSCHWQCKINVRHQHLKVSAKTLGFNKFKAIKDLKILLVITNLAIIIHILIQFTI